MDRVVHFEIPVDDQERAKDFYSKVFGWKMNNTEYPDYTILTTSEVDEETRMIKEPGSINGGMGPRKGQLMSPTITIEVEDIDEAVEKIVAAGGQKMEDKMEVGDMGWSAYFKDTEGNVIGLWQTK